MKPGRKLKNYGRPLLLLSFFIVSIVFFSACKCKNGNAESIEKKVEIPKDEIEFQQNISTILRDFIPTLPTIKNDSTKYLSWHEIAKDIYLQNNYKSLWLSKNVFYKDIKHEQHENLTKKLALVEQAKSLQESTDFNTATPIMKKIQDDWKKIGHVPRKYSDSIWKDFKDACNAYFDRMHEARNAESSEEVEAFEKKKAFLEELKDFTLSGEHKADLDAIKEHIATWKTFGKVPFNRRHIEGKFNKILDALFEKLSMSKKDTEMMRFSNRLEQMSDNDDKRALEQEQFFIRKKIDEVQSEIFQLENNIQFISSSSVRSSST